MNRRTVITAFATPGFLIGLLAVMAAFYTADQFLASLERREIAADARRFAATGESLMQQARYHDAVEAFRRAESIERGNRNYRLLLADALIRNNQSIEAIPVLDDVLEEDSNDGQANLLTARAMAQQERFGSADSFYHRAIYGAWPAPQHDHAVQARLELVRWLAGRGEKESLLSELIPLEQSAPSDASIARALPRFYLQAGAVRQAERAYRELVREQPADAEAHAGLARVEVEKGNFNGAERHFAAALERDPHDAALDREAQIARTAQRLDPTSRQLSTSDKLERSRRILSIAIDAVKGCGNNPQLALVSELLGTAPQNHQSNELAEERLDTAVKLWQSRPESCKPATVEAAALTPVLRKVEQ